MSQIEPRNRAERRAAEKKHRKRGAAGAIAATKIGAVVATTAAAAFVAGASPASAATFNVTNNSENPATAGSLAKAIKDANADPSTADTISIAAGLNIPVTTALDTIVGPVDIVGPGAASTTITGHDSNRIFYINASSATFNVTISGLTLTHTGSATSGDGGAILNNTAHLSISDSTITGNDSDDQGGGVASFGETNALTVQNTTVSGNTSGSGGGGIHVTDQRADVKILTSTISGNTADSWGGGLYFYSENGVLDIEGSTFSDNTATNNGGGGGWIDGDSASATINDTTATGNSAAWGGGGFYLGTDRVDINRTTINGNNHADTDGGGLYLTDNVDGVSIHDSTISGNSAGDDGGGAYFEDSSGAVEIVNTTVSGNTSGDEGGGINFYYHSASIDISTSTISDNTAKYGGGGVYVNDDESGSQGTFTMRDSTVSGNTSQNSFGGGLYIGNQLNSTKILNSTISGNTAAEEGGGINFNGYYGLVLTQDTITNNTGSHYGGLYIPADRAAAASKKGAKAADAGEAGEKSKAKQAHEAAKGPHEKGGVKAQLTNKYEHDGETTSTGTIIAGNHSAKSSDGVDVGPGSVIHSDHSLFGTVGPDTTIDDKGGTLTNTDPKLGPLQNNGGPTETHELLAGSPAIDTGPVPSTISTDQVGNFDQRGTPYDRVENGLIDIGAFEVQLAPAPPTPEPVVPAAVLITPKFTG